MTSKPEEGGVVRNDPEQASLREGHWRKRVLVCGGRYFDNLLAVRRVLSGMDGEQAGGSTIAGTDCPSAW